MSVGQQTRVSGMGHELYEALAFLTPILFFGILATIRVVVFIDTGSMVALLNAFGLAILTSMFVLRRPPREVDRSISSLFAALVGNFLPFCFILRGRSDWAGDVPVVIEVVTVVLAIWTVLSLRTGMGITPANRGVKTGGPYRVIRHPLYALVILSQVGLLLVYPLPFNFVVLAAAIVFKARMILNEERILRRDPVYAAYMERVRYRAIPGLL